MGFYALLLGFCGCFYGFLRVCTGSRVVVSIKPLKTIQEAKKELVKPLSLDPETEPQTKRAQSMLLGTFRLGPLRAESFWKSLGATLHSPTAETVPQPSNLWVLKKPARGSVH